MAAAVCMSAQPCVCMYEGERGRDNRKDSEPEEDRQDWERGLMWCHIVDNHLYACCVCLKQHVTMTEVLLYHVKAAQQL